MPAFEAVVAMLPVVDDLVAQEVRTAVVKVVGTVVADRVPERTVNQELSVEEPFADTANVGPYVAAGSGRTQAETDLLAREVVMDMVLMLAMAAAGRPAAAAVAVVDGTAVARAAVDTDPAGVALETSTG